jgi:anionic cell wall polymer biosynthesis LytR-Cps2A-Psr (LCP) family protein
VLTGRDWRALASRTGYVASCAFAAIVLAVAGYAHYVENQVGGLASSNVDTGGPQTGAMNILLMGLESRTDYHGNVLPASLLAAMHAGSVQGVLHGGVGGQDTNTLILIHIFAGGQKAVGFSIPRDDLVSYPHPTYQGITQGKIDQAYDFAYNQSLGQTFGSHLTQDQRYTQANEAGQAFEIDTVQTITGVHIDHFLEMNLAGFYNLAAAFGGIEVCVKPAPAGAGFPAGANLTDRDVLTGTDNSGFNAYRDGYNRKKGGAQYLHLNAGQSLAFVRSRDTLPGIDLGRTTRQQAVIDYVIWKLGHQGMLTSFSQLTNLLGVAKKYVVAPSGWDLLTFASEMHALTGRNLTLSTLPVASTPTVQLNGSRQDVNIIDLPRIREIVQTAFSRPPGSKPKTTTRKKPANTTPIPQPSTVTVDVYNGGTTNMLAADVSQALVSAGYKAGAVGSPAAQKQTVQAATQVFYGAGAAANAAKIAGYFGATATAASSLAAGHVEVLLGTTSTAVPAALSSGAATAPATGPSTGPATATSSAPKSQSSNALTVKANAPYGIPCVY